MRKLVVALLVLVALFAAADFAARGYAESRAGRTLQSSLGLSKEPTVSLAGFPFLFHLASGDFSSITLTDHDFMVKGVAIRRATVTLRDVSFTPSALLSSNGGDIHVGRGEGTAVLTADAVTAIFREQGVPVRVRFAAGKAVLTSSKLPGRIEGSLTVSGTELVVHATAAGLSYSLPLPTLVPGISYTGVRIDGDAALLSFEVTQRTIRV